MLSKIKSLGIKIDKIAQQSINGGSSSCNGSTCSTYNGPLSVTCKQYYALPPEYKCCVRVSIDCFPQ